LDLLTILASSSNSFLINPDTGLTVWTLLAFAISFYLLKKLAFPRIRAALEERSKRIAESIEAAERTRAEAERLLAEYRQRLHEAREQAEEIIRRARQTAQAHEAQAREEAQRIAAEGVQRAQREIEEATQQSLARLRSEVAELTVLATEKVTRKALDRQDQLRLVQEALAELDLNRLSALAGAADGN